MNTAQVNRRAETAATYAAARKHGEPVEFFERSTLRGGTLFDGRIYSIGPVNQGPFSFAAA